jgi:hypothetical protein
VDEIMWSCLTLFECSKDSAIAALARPALILSEWLSAKGGCSAIIAEIFKIDVIK